MSRGKIEQVGTPQDIYNTPRTRFVADFLGSSNIFTGTDRGSRAGTVRIDTPVGALRQPVRAPADAPAVGSTATITVLDSRMHLSPAHPSGAVNAVPVRLVGEDFLGATATLYLETGESNRSRSDPQREGCPVRR